MGLVGRTNKEKREKKEEQEKERRKIESSHPATQPHKWSWSKKERYTE